MNTSKKYSWTITGVLLGALGGFLYWNFIGCSSGQCMITSVWYNSAIYGGLMGGLVGNSLSKNKTKEKTKEHEL